jgi:hypothetical protein
MVKEAGSRPYDINCIKKHEQYLSGIIGSANSVEVSVAKVKKLGKSMNATVNDVMLGIATTVLKKHFVLEKDETEAVTLSVPFSFKCVPEKVEDYVYKNTLTTPLSLYVKLTNTFEEGVS